MDLLMSSRTLSHPLQVFRRFLGRSPVSVSPSSGSVLRSAVVLCRTSSSAIRMWRRRPRRLPTIRFRHLLIRGRCSPDISFGGRRYGFGAGRHLTCGSIATHRTALRAGSAVGAGCCSIVSHRRSSRDPSTPVAAGPGGPVPAAAISRVDPFIGGWLRFPEYVIPQFGL